MNHYVVGLIASGFDEVEAANLRGWLESAGISIVDSASVTIVFITPRALSDHRWRAELAALTEGRLVPVALAGVSDDAVPERLREINWTVVDGDGTWFAKVLAAIAYEPTRYRLAQQIVNESRVWHTSGRPDDRLIADASRVRELQRLQAEMAGPSVADFDDVASEFLDASLVKSKRKKTWRSSRRSWGLAIGLSAFAATVSIVGAMLLTAGVNRASVGLLDTPWTERELPKWTAANAASVLLDGEPEQQEVARERLRRLMASPWSRGGADVSGGSIEYVEPSVVPGASLLVNRLESGVSDLVLYDERTSQEVWRMGLGAEYFQVDFLDDVALVSGPDGVALVDLEFESVEVVQTSVARDAWLAPDGGLAIIGEEEVKFVTADGADIELPYSHDQIVSNRAIADGAAAVVVLDEDTYRYYIEGAEQFVIGVPAGDPALAGVSADGESVYVTGDDGQIWSVGGAGASPTGLPAVGTENGLWGLGDERLVVSSSTLGVQVFHLPTGLKLGNVCDDVYVSVYVTFSSDHESVSCVARGFHNVWNVPAAPQPEPPSDTIEGRIVTLAESDTITIEIGGEEMIIDHESIVADVAITGDGKHVIIRDVAGKTVGYDVRRSSAASESTRHELAPAFETIVADPGPITGISSAGDELWLETASGWWETPACFGCSEDVPLLREVGERTFGCWTRRQQQSMTSSSFAALNFTSCSR